ncbi:MAG: glycoside hydrolase family 31 protein [Collinsella sp.]|nr:glycoside hydrolase family 31 protein [Collinsella sp.]
MKRSTADLLIRGGVGIVFASTLAFASAATPAMAYADAAQASSYQGTLKSVVDAKRDADRNYVAYVTFNDNVTAKITFLEQGIFRYNVDLSGEFSPYAAPRSADHVARIQAQPDTSDKYQHPEVTVTDTGTAFEITDGAITISFDKSSAKMTVKSKDKVVFEEEEALTLTKQSTTQTLSTGSGESFFGGGTQNGRFNHTGDAINIKNESSWTDGGVSSPNPFYWTSDGYGVLRNTFAQGRYDFGSSTDGVVSTTHDEGEFDAYYFVSDDAGSASVTPVAQDLLQGYFKVTGDPVLLPEYAFYLGHYNAYNRDAWSAEQKDGYRKWQFKGHDAATDPNAGEIVYERGGTGVGAKPNELIETLNGTGPTFRTENVPEGVTYSPDFSARRVIDRYQGMDMPIGYLLPNDGYGAGYGQNGYNVTGGVNEDGTSSAERLEAVAKNVENLKDFTAYANDKGLATGLWTQSDLTPDSKPQTPWHTLRDFESEVTKGGVTTLKTDVAWVGAGYSFGLNGTKFAYDTVTEKANFRPNIVSLDGWAGTQRFAGIWTGDQTGGDWEYIRFHIPTYIGQSLSGNPNIGSDMDGIFGGSPLIATRDYQWKSFTPLMLDMDGWGAYAKSPFTHGDPYTGVSRLYLKLKSQLMPYIYTTAASAANIDTGNGDAGLPIIRAMMFSDDSAFAASEATKYQYTLGEDFLVAPVYQNTAADEAGNDVRNGIYLPGDENTIWIDYFTGKQYRGGQVLNNFDAPLWKLPLFVKANAIVPMYEPNNNPDKVTESNPGGLDKTKRIVEFFATTGDNTYTLFEDTGTFAKNDIDTSDAEYGKEGNVSYGEHVSTVFSSSVKEGTATFEAKQSQGGYEGYDAKRDSTFVVNVSAKPEKVVAKNGQSELKTTEVSSRAEFDKAAPKDGEAVVFYDEKPNLNYNAFADDEAVRNEGFSKTEITTTPKLFVKFAKTDVNANAQTLVLTGFKNDGNLPANQLDESLAVPQLHTPGDEDKTPTSIKMTWDKVEGATGYDIEFDGTVNSIPSADITEYLASDLAYHSTHTFRIRTRAASGYSKWSEELPVQTLEDPWRNVPTPVDTDWEGDYYGGFKEGIAFDHQLNDAHFHSGGNDIGKKLTVDYGKAYTFEKLEYYPRSDAGNGTVSRMQIETSLDGNHWKDHGAFDWAVSGDVKTADLGLTKARYVRLTPLASVGNFFSAREIAIYKQDGTVGMEVGSINGDATLDNADYDHLKGNCLGRENRGGDEEQFQTHIAKNAADFNGNDAYDVYDMAFTMFKLDGGTKKKDKLGGNIVVIPSASEVKTGDVIDVDLYVDDIKNANALGALVNFKSADFQFVGDSISQNPYTSSMENLSIAKTSFSDGLQSVNLALVNRGDKDLYSGTGAVVSFKLKALHDGKVELPSTAWAVGPTYDFVEVVNDGEVTLPEKPTPTESEYGQDAFDISITNDLLPKDDGTNVTKLIQQGSFNALFDNDEASNGFEFKWDLPSNYVDGELPKYVKLPTTMTFTFKTPSVLDKVEVLNRQGGNGTVSSMDATIVYEDGAKDNFTFDATQDVFVLEPTADHAGKKAVSVAITPKTSAGQAHASDPANRMLTLREINFKYTTGVAAVEKVELGENAKSLHVGDLSRVQAKVLPESVGYPYLIVTSSDPSVASVSMVPAGEGVANYIRANKPGTTTITVASALDETKTATYDLTVEEGVDASKLQDALETARGYSADAYTEESYGKLAEAVSAAEKLLASGSYSKQDVAQATIAIEKAIEGLKMRPVDESRLINKDADSGVKVIGASSAASESPYEDALDYNEGTFWHSSYSDAELLPDYLLFDLGDLYDLTDVTFLPRQDGGTNGDIFEAKLYVADTAEALEGEDAGTYVGTFTFDNNGRILNNRTEYQQMAFGATPARFVKFVATKAGGDQADAYASAAEFRFYGSKHEEPSVADKTALKELVDKFEAEGLKPEDHTPETWKPYELALSDAKATLADPNATQAEVDSQLAALQSAHDALEKAEVPPVDAPTREDLSSLIDKATKLDTTGKTPGSVQALKDAIEFANKVVSDPDASPEQIKAAYDQLAAAIEGLTNASGGQGGQGGNQGGSQGGSTDGTLAATGDASLFAALATGLGAFVAGGFGIRGLRKKRD